MMKKLMILFVAIVCLGCQKDFLDTKPDKSLLVPTTVTEIQALLDNTTVFNITPGMTGIADGDFYTTDAAWKTWSTDAERNSYSWNADIWGTFAPADWRVPNQQIFYANAALDGLSAITSEDAAYKSAKGQALFARAYAYYHLLQEFGGSELGLPIRQVSDVTRNPPRSTSQETYAQILTDLLQARQLVPAQTVSKSRPNLTAVYAMLAKTHLVLGNYEQAGKYADSAIKGGPALLDYNTLSTTATRPFTRSVPTGTDEVVYYSSAVSLSFASNASTLVDTLLYRSYATNDLRKVILFKTSGLSGTFKGNYSGIVALFSGIAVDELYLIRAECSARSGSSNLLDLNTVLAKRWKTGTFIPLTAANAEAALKLVLSERRKELVGRVIRWSDLRRLNGDSRFAVTLTRKINGQSFTLEAGSKRYAYPFPQDEVNLSGIGQNER